MASGAASSGWSTLLLQLLIPLSFVYATGQRLRVGLYRAGILKTRKLTRPVVSIGNITVGGTGKTPVTAHIARFLLARGYRVTVLSRGYGGSLEGQTAVVSDGSNILHNPEQCGDEPFLLARSVPGLAVVIGSDRFAAGQLALKECAPDIFLLDDGFQHLRLHRDLNILLLDFARPFGNGWTLPAGLLREPIQAALRADWIIHTRCDSVIADIPLLTQIPQTSCRYRLGRLIPLGGGESLEMSAFAGLPLIACAGIAEPEQFFVGLEQRGLRLLRRLPLADHAAYDMEVVSGIKEAMSISKARYCVVTEKDAVKLVAIAGELEASILVAPLEIDMEDAGLMTDLLKLL
jgi:tetraacyldisaccharide 4'-kinase